MVELAGRLAWRVIQAFGFAEAPGAEPQNEFP